MHDKQTVREELSNLPLNINSDAVGFGSNHPSNYRCKAQELTKIIGTRDGWLVFSWRAEVFFNRSTISGGGGGGKGKVGVKKPYLSINSKLTLHEIKVLEINANLV